MSNESYIQELPPSGCDVDEVLAPLRPSIDDDVVSHILATARGLRYGSVDWSFTPAEWCRSSGARSCAPTVDKGRHRDP